MMTTYALIGLLINTNSTLSVPSQFSTTRRVFLWKTITNQWINALISVAHELGVATEVLEAVVETNDRVREDRDWEDMKGRAVV